MLTTHHSEPRSYQIREVALHYKMTPYYGAHFRTHSSEATVWIVAVAVAVAFVVVAVAVAFVVVAVAFVVVAFLVLVFAFVVLVFAFAVLAAVAAAAAGIDVAVLAAAFLRLFSAQTER